MPRQHLRYSIEYGRRWANSPIKHQPDLLPEDLNHKPLHLAGHWLVQARKTGVIFYTRATTQKQQRLGRLQNDITAAQEWLREHSVPIHQTISGVESNCIYADRPHLDKAIRRAEKLNTPVVTSTRDRFIRHFAFDGKSNETETPDAHEYRFLRIKFGYVRYLTIEHPDQRGKSQQTRNGRKRKKKRRTKYKTRQKHKLMPRILELLRDGLSQRQIARVLGVNQSQISRWIKSQNNLQEPVCNPATILIQ